MNPLKRGSGLPTAKDLPMFKVKVDGKVVSITIGLPTRVKVEPGMYEVQVVVGSYRTNKLAVEVSDGGRHVIQVAPTELRRLKYVTGGGFPLLAAIKPGVYWRLELPKA